MFFFLKFIIYFSISFVILSVPMGNKLLFNHLQSLTAPYTQNIFNEVETITESATQQTKNIGKKFFTNSTPNKDPKIDKVKTQASGIDKNYESYTPEEKELLLKILNQ